MPRRTHRAPTWRLALSLGLALSLLLAPPRPAAVLRTPAASASGPI